MTAGCTYFSASAPAYKMTHPVVSDCERAKGVDFEAAKRCNEKRRSDVLYNHELNRQLLILPACLTHCSGARIAKCS